MPIELDELLWLAMIKLLFLLKDSELYQQVDPRFEEYLQLENDPNLSEIGAKVQWMISEEFMKLSSEQLVFHLDNYLVVAGIKEQVDAKMKELPAYLEMPLLVDVVK